VKYRELKFTSVNNVLTQVVVDVVFHHGYQGCGPFAVVTFPDEPSGQPSIKYSVDQDTLAQHFEQLPNQHVIAVSPEQYKMLEGASQAELAELLEVTADHIELTTISPPGVYDRT
jgi:hypothetical protein